MVGQTGHDGAEDVGAVVGHTGQALGVVGQAGHVGGECGAWVVGHAGQVVGVVGQIGQVGGEGVGHTSGQATGVVGQVGQVTGSVVVGHTGQVQGVVSFDEPNSELLRLQGWEIDTRYTFAADLQRRMYVQFYIQCTAVHDRK